TVHCEGDLAVDDHHTVEDVAITLGEAIDEALGDRRGIVRYADRRVPLDEALASVVVDISGRPYFVFDGEFSQTDIGDFTSDMAGVLPPEAFDPDPFMERMEAYGFPYRIRDSRREHVDK
ncbi:MAG: hypothetical protein R6V46_09960, partial [Desulfatiglandaceae bacterium]